MEWTVIEDETVANIVNTSSNKCLSDINRIEDQRHGRDAVTCKCPGLYCSIYISAQPGQGSLKLLHLTNQVPRVKSKILNASSLRTFPGSWLCGCSGEKGLEGISTSRTTTSSSASSPWATSRAAIRPVPLPISDQSTVARVTCRKWYSKLQCLTVYRFCCFNKKACVLFLCISFK